MPLNNAKNFVDALEKMIDEKIHLYNLNFTGNKELSVMVTKGIEEAKEEMRLALTGYRVNESS